MSRWSVAELTLGLYKLAHRHYQEGVKDTIHGEPITARLELEEILHWLRWAMAAYKSDSASLARLLHVDKDHILRHSIKSQIQRPAFFVALDHERELVVLGIRGTSAATDVLTDLTPHCEPFQDGYAHSGMLGSAKWLLREEVPGVRQLLAENKGYDLVITGHSLGAGTAALLTMMLRLPHLSDSIASPISQHLGVPLTSILCWAFACPPCVDHRLASASPFVRTVVLADDVVARASASALEDLRSEIIDTNWSQVLKDGSKRSHIFMMAHATDCHLSRMELALGYEKGHLYKKMAQLGGMVRGRLQHELFARMEEVKAGDHGEKAKAAVQWLSTGAVIVNAILSVASTYIASDISDIITAPPLVVPGLLYHVVRQTLQAGEVPPLTIEDLTGEAGSSEAEQGDNGGAGSLRVREVVLWLQAEQEDEREAALQHKSSRSWWAWGGSSSKSSSSKKDDEAVDATMKPGGSCKRVEEDLLAEMVVNGVHRGGESMDAATIVKPGTRANQPDKGESSSWWASLRRKKVEDEPGVAGAGAVTIETDGNGKEVNEEVHEKGAERKVEAVPVRHVVIQGTDPNCRFKRIVLSNTMLSDHGCYSCRDGLLDALRWTA
eukprot:SM000357S13383  [mRNA]  locus=s357:20987:24466:+ [translate_table: standard]